jgi:hypothetical protein
MTQTNRFPAHPTASIAARSRRRSPHAASRPERRPSARLISDAVVAGYIHDISQRHRDAARPGTQRRPNEAHI